MRGNVVHLLGSDCHNTTDRSYCMGKAVKHLIKHGMTRRLRLAAELSQEIFEKAMGE